MLITDCPRCGSQRITFDATASIIINTRYGWQNWYETFCICRHCRRTTIFVLSEKTDSNYKLVHEVGLLKMDLALNNYCTVEGFVSLKDRATTAPPEFIPREIEEVFREGAICLAVGCYNAAGTMFRLCVDLTTRSMLPAEDVEGLTKRIRRDLGLRLPWLFENNLLPRELEGLSSCIREDGNDGAHAGTLEKADAEDLLDFTERLLDRIYSEPERLRLAAERRVSRRSDSGD